MVLETFRYGDRNFTCLLDRVTNMFQLTELQLGLKFSTAPVDDDGSQDGLSLAGGAAHARTRSNSFRRSCELSCKALVVGFLLRSDRCFGDCFGDQR